MKTTMRKRPEPLSPEAWDEIKFIWESSGNITKAAERYGVSRRSIYLMAKKYGWSKRGGLSKKAMERASEKFIEEAAGEYEKEIEEVCNKNLKSFRFLHDVALAAAVEVKNSLISKIEYNRMARAVNRARIEEAKGGRRSVLMPILDITKETSQINSLGNTVKQAIMDGERVIMGITDYNPHKEKDRDSRNPIDRMIDVLQAGITEFNEGVANGTVDPNTGDVIQKII